MKSRRLDRVNSLLREVIAEVIQREVKNPHLPEIISISRVEVTQDLQQAKVYISLFGGNKEQALQALTKSAGFIAARASKKVTLRYFPELFFRLDDTLEKQLKIHELLTEINNEKQQRDDDSLEKE